MATRPLIIDTDPGKDDAVAILTALGLRESINVILLSTVAGNVSLAQTTANALRLCHVKARTDIPVHAGCPRALLQSGNTVPDIHGEDGLGGAILPPPTTRPADGHAVPAIIEAIRNASEPVTIAALAPMTNLALALVMAPDIVANIAEIAVMGGSFSGGNITPYASYNMHSDPHAARIVFSSGASVTMVGLDVTRKTMPTPRWLAELKATNKPAAKVVAELWDDPTLCFNDACVIAHIMQPDIFRSDRRCIEIELNDPIRIGETRVIAGEARTTTLLDIDREAFFSFVYGALTTSQ
ncbi:MAG: nucleoside hydrolase [Alphaproteobacteria bacterium]|nr:nucleoside hydrolase [Alphaproteobacteria bacterium]